MSLSASNKVSFILISRSADFRSNFKGRNLTPSIKVTARFKSVIVLILPLTKTKYEFMRYFKKGF